MHKFPANDRVFLVVWSGFVFWILFGIVEDVWLRLHSLSRFIYIILPLLTAIFVLIACGLPQAELCEEL